MTTHMADIWALKGKEATETLAYRSAGQTEEGNEDPKVQ